MKNNNKDIPYAKISVDVISKVERYQKDYNKNTKNEAVEELLEIGYIVIERWKELKENPELLAELVKQFNDGTVADKVRMMPDDMFEVIFQIMKTEKVARYGSRDINLI